ncbi:MAG: hypothetical protein KBD47_02005 [Candidatus Pacebacteria bacterium]|nr:hypothetical protein [Candidatus Paceibacterota bacterium]
MIKTIIYIIIGVVILSYLGVDIKRAVESPTTKENFSYITQAGIYVWDHVLEKPVTYIWNEVVVDLVWDSLIEKLKNNPPTMSTSTEQVSQ